MKRKKINILFIIMTICMVFIGMPKVEAAKSSMYCSYAKGNSNFTVYLFSDGNHAVATDHVLTYVQDGDESLKSLFVVEGDTIYCPEKIYYKIDLNDTLMMRRYLSNKNYKSYSQEFATDYATLLLKQGSGVVSYDLGMIVEEEYAEIKICKTGGKAFLENAKKSYTLSLESKEAKLTEDDIRKMSEKERDELFKGLQEIYKRETKKNENGEYLVTKSVLDELKMKCFKHNTEEYNSLYTEFINNGNIYREKLAELLTILSKIQTEEGKRTKEEHEEFVDEMHKEINAINNQYKVELQQVPESDTIFSCEGLIADELEEVIKLALKIIRIGAPIILIVMCALDFSQVVISNDQDALKKATSKVVKRMLAAIGLFLVPLLVSVAIDWIDESNPNLNCTEVIEQ